MPQGFRGWALWVVAQGIVTFAWHILIKLAENAMLGWGDEQIAIWLGINSPALSTVFSWAVPFVLAGLTLAAYHAAQVRWFNGPRVAIYTVGNPQGAIRDSIISQIPRHLYAQGARAEKTLGRKVVFGWILIIASVVGIIVGAILVLTSNSTSEVSIGPPPSSPPPVTDGFEWDNHLGHTYSGTPPEIITNAFSIGAVNKSGRQIELQEAFVNSDYSGDRIDLEIAQGGNWVKANAAPPIEAGQSIYLRLQFNPALAASYILRDWKSMTATLVYTNTPHKHQITEQMVQLVYANFRPMPTAAPPALPLDTSPRPKPHYSTGEIERMIRALSDLHDIITTRIAPALNDARQLLGRWQQIVQPETALAHANEYGAIMGRILGARTDMAKIIADNQLYQNAISPTITDEKGALPTLATDLGDVSGDLGELAKAPQGINYTRFMEPKWQKLAGDIMSADQWLGLSEKRIVEKTEELREWKND
jgi:hypothetical protein